MLTALAGWLDADSLIQLPAPSSEYSCNPPDVVIPPQIHSSYRSFLKSLQLVGLSAKFENRKRPDLLSVLVN